ncbi:hypothetical protein GQR58_024407 [Nymphon striatum]|nr:hypothetical protein GQR58_024407 [Nymphon striatum]
MKNQTNRTLIFKKYGNQILQSNPKYSNTEEVFKRTTFSKFEKCVSMQDEEPSWRIAHKYANFPEKGYLHIDYLTCIFITQIWLYSVHVICKCNMDTCVLIIKKMPYCCQSEKSPAQIPNIFTPLEPNKIQKQYKTQFIVMV